MSAGGSGENHRPGVEAAPPPGVEAAPPPGVEAAPPPGSMAADVAAGAVHVPAVLRPATGGLLR